MSLPPEIRRAIERHYDLKITRAIAGPRQFVARTYVLDDDQGRRHFCKLVDKPLFVAEIIRSLPLVARMRALGMTRICCPLAGPNGLVLQVGDTLATLYDYIPALQSYDYSAFAFGHLMAQIHALPTDAAESCRTFFDFPYPREYDAWFGTVPAARGGDPAVDALRQVLRRHERAIHGAIARFHTLAEGCRTKPFRPVFTHGDAPGNVLVRAPNDLYIVDWDETLVGPAERDLWMIDHLPEFRRGYQSVRPDVAADDDLRSFCILRYYLQRNIHFCAEILRETATIEARMTHVRSLEAELLDGWMLPKLREAMAHGH